MTDEELRWLYDRLGYLKRDSARDHKDFQEIASKTDEILKRRIKRLRISFILARVVWLVGSIAYRLAPGVRAKTLVNKYRYSVVHGKWGRRFFLWPALRVLRARKQFKEKQEFLWTLEKKEENCGMGWEE